MSNIPNPVITLKEVAMSERVDKFCGRLRERLNAIAGRFESGKPVTQ